jgi:hypothetical protein
MGSLGLGAINLLRGLPFIRSQRVVGVLVVRVTTLDRWDDQLSFDIIWCLKRTGIAQLNWFGWKFL